MREREISEAEVLELSTRDEGHFYDRKAKQLNGAKTQKIAVAFANADGGDFIVGIKDDKDEADPNKRWDGAVNKEYFNAIIQSLQNITPSIPKEIEFLFDKSSSTYGLRVIIEKSEKVHYTADKTVYVRAGAQSIPVKEPDKIQALAFAKGETSYEDFIYKDGKPEDIFESMEIVRFLREFAPKSDPIDFTVNQNLVHRDTYEPKMSGLLLFNDNPVSLLPRKCGIKITRYETDDEIPNRDNLKEQLTIEGCLYEQIHGASESISNLMSNIKIWTPDGLKNVDYPPETIWEILVNAIIHRDYSISDDIHILIFNNRIEISSPGKLPGYVTENNLLDARYSRNPKIVRTLNRYRNPPNKDMGEGLNTAFQKMAEWQLKPPIIKEVLNTVKVIIPHVSLASPEERIIEFLKSHDKIKNREARDLSGIKSENKMKNVFYKMRDNNLLEPVLGKTGRTIAWKLKK